MNGDTLNLLTLGVLVPVAAAAWWAGLDSDASSSPHAMWHNGVIVHVRGCDEPNSEAARLTCAGLYCAQSVTVKLTNAQQARLSVNVRERNSQGEFHIAGSIDQYLNARTLPKVFECTMRHYHRAQPAIFVAERP